MGAVLLSTAAEPTRAPVLVELFTSEGCSSCPPADRLLEQLDARAVVLSEHVDYWDHEGWKDRFSSPTVTLRQQAYGRQFGLDSVYTPEMVIDGSVEFSGGEGARALAEISKAERRKKAEVRVSSTAGGLQVEVSDAPKSADVVLALAEDSGTSQVSGGENSGRRLHHVSIVRNLRKIGSVKRGGSFSRTIELPETGGAQRVVVFLQEPGHGPVYGAAMLRLGS
jgi:hypothetical protein